MSQINPQLQKILDDFAQNSLPNGKNSNEYRNLIATVTASPVLTERLNTAAEKGYLDKLAVNKNPNAGASYNASKTRISINLSQLKTRLLFQTTFLDKRSSERSASLPRKNPMQYTIATALTIGLLLSACSTVKHMPAKEGNIMNQDTQQIAGRPNLTALEVLTKVLDFLRYAQSPEDFEIETAGKVMNLKLLERTDGYSDFYIGNKFGDSDWIWSINFTKDQSGKMRLHFGDGGGNLPATPICQMDLDQFHPLLEQAGFTYTGKGRLGKPFNGYEKKYPNGYEADLQVFYQGESAEKVLHDCINEITFDIFKPES